MLGLATGATPQKVYAHLVAMHEAGELSFRNVVTYNLDEYYPIQPLDPKSYRSYMHRHLFSRVDLPANQAHVLDGTVPPAFVAEHCAQFDRWIAADGGLDLQLLGIGRNGHIGFNEPSDLPWPRPLHCPPGWSSCTPSTRADAAREFGGARPRHPPRPDHGRGPDPGRPIDPDARHRTAQSRDRGQRPELSHDRQAARLAAPVGRRTASPGCSTNRPRVSFDAISLT